MGAATSSLPPSSSPAMSLRDVTMQFNWPHGVLLSGDDVVREWKNKQLNSVDDIGRVNLSLSTLSNLTRDEQMISNKMKRFFNRNVSDKNNNRVPCVFENDMDSPICLCWIDFEGGLYHFRRVGPKTRHFENSFVGHSFVGWKIEDDKIKGGNRLKEMCVRHDPIISYRPLHALKGDKPHIIKCRDASSGTSKCHTLRKRGRAVVNTRSKRYNRVYVKCEDGTRWTLMCEPGWEESCKDFRDRFESDLEAASNKLPLHAREKLSKHIQFWINVRQKYGKKDFPTEGRNMCFHPESKWLKSNGMSTRKCHGIELYRTTDYMTDYDLWGNGGVLLHELSHAWHCCFVKNGYRNKDIQTCFDKAMKEGLYDKVKVHGPQGPMARAYACTNAMEYFAELSVAFLHKHKSEYNKWYPFNHLQLQSHDKRACSLLEKCWGEALST